METCTHVLLVDDEPRIREIYAMALQEAGYTVRTAADAAEAFVLLATERFEIAFIDHNLGTVSGLELIRQMEDLVPEVYPVIITAEGSTDLAVRALKNGAADFIVKPFTLVDLVKSIDYVDRKRVVDRQRLSLMETLEKKVQEKTTALQDVYFNVLSAFAQAMEKKDLGTYGHSRRVSHVSRLIAAALDLCEEDKNNLKVAALLHDIGKIGIADFVLGKKGKLDELEYASVCSHPQKGVEILKPLLKNFKQLHEVLPAIRHHHEHFNGNGYPGKLSGEEIPRLARIICIADTYDAIRSDRPYRRGATHEEALAELQRCVGTQFDPEIVASFVRTDEQYRRLKRQFDHLPENLSASGTAEA